MAANKDFKGTPIVPKAYESLPKREQYNEKTTVTAKAIGNLFGISPMEVDHLINNYFGIFGQINKAPKQLFASELYCYPKHKQFG